MALKGDIAGAERQRRYRTSQGGKLADERYRKSSKRTAALRRYTVSEKGRGCRKRYKHTDAGKLQVQKSNNKFRADNPLYHRDMHLRRTYGMSLVDWEVLFAAQNNCCAACRTDAPRMGGWHVDHNHDTGEVRGILCGSCNIALGNAMDSPETLRALATYLERNTEVGV